MDSYYLMTLGPHAEEILDWAVGPDKPVFLASWPERIRQRTGLDVKASDLIEPTLQKLRAEWERIHGEPVHV